MHGAGGHRAQRVAAFLAAAVLLAALSPMTAMADDRAIPQPFELAGFGSDPAGGPRVTMAESPPFPDGWYGWHVTYTQVTLAVDRPATIRYQWNGTAGIWEPYAGPIAAPVGRNILYAQAVGDDGVAGPIIGLEVKLDYLSPARSYTPASPPAAWATGSSVGIGVSVTFTVRPQAGPRVIRVFGPDRYGTSQQISLKDFPSAPVVIIARGDLFPDALSAAGLAGLYGAPILLTKPSALPSNISAEIKRVGAKRATMVGGTGAVSASIEKQLKGLGLTVERIGGANRYETSALIARAIVRRGGQASSVFVARGDLYPDALAVSPFAFRARRPVLLVMPRSLPDVTAQTLRDLGCSEALVAGSEGAVSRAVANGVAGIIGHQPARAGGADRYGTACAVADYGVGAGLGGYGFVGMATGQNFPDTLCGGAAVGGRNGVILMTQKAGLNPLTEKKLRDNGPALREVQVFGGEAAISRAAWDAIVAAVH